LTGLYNKPVCFFLLVLIYHKGTKVNGGLAMKETVLKEFEKVFGDTDGVKVFFAPGRVNLIGEHTDYNGGHVFPCALTIGTYAAARVRNDRKLRF